MNRTVSVNGREYEVIKLLGHGKGGYSYLAESEGKKVVLKQIHHEPCAYYHFGNKIEAEINDYRRLQKTGIRMPLMLDVDETEEIIIKEYIDGITIFEMLCHDMAVEQFIPQVMEMAQSTKKAGLNIDFFPTNFVVCDDLIYYVDYECNEYSEEWNFENWGSRYWSKTPEFEEYLKGLETGMNKTIEYYDRNAEEYFAYTVRADMSDHYERFRKYLEKGDYILDLGCGSGRDSRYFIDQGYRVKAVDGSRQMCLLASRYLKQEVENLLFEEIAFENEFDAVWANASLLHVKKEKLQEVIGKIRTALKKNGIFYLSFKYGDGDRLQGERYYNDLNEEGIRELLKDFLIRELWFSDDTIPGKNDHWISCIAEKV